VLVVAPQLPVPLIRISWWDGGESHLGAAIVGPLRQDQPVGSYNGAVATIVHVPESLAGRLAAEAARRGLSVEALSTELLAAGLGEDDPLEEFIGSGHSGRGDLGRRHREIKAALTRGQSAAEL